MNDFGPPSYQYDEDIVVQLGDYYNNTDANIEAGLLAQPFVWSGETKAILVNGQSGTAGFSNATDASCTPYTISVEPGSVYRMRFIGRTAISLVTLGIEGHSNLTIIEADGADTLPYQVDHVQVGAGQRFSILFQAKTLAELQADGQSTYWIQYENRDRPANVSGYALLSYNVPNGTIPTTLPDSPPLTLPPEIDNWLEYALSPLDPTTDPFPSLAEVTRTVVITVQQITNDVGNISAGTLQWAENNDTWQTERVYIPYLVNIYENGQAAVPNYTAALANYGWDPATLAFPALLGEVLDIVWVNDNGESGGWDIHPFHAHGGHYWDLGSGNGTYNATENERLFEAGFVPLKRDTTMLYRYADIGAPYTAAGWRAWRIRVQDPGSWMMHCHILAHMIMGKQSTDFRMIENENGIRSADIMCVNRYADRLGLWQCSRHHRPGPGAICGWLLDVWRECIWQRDVRPDCQSLLAMISLLHVPSERRGGFGGSALGSIMRVSPPNSTTITYHHSRTQAFPPTPSANDREPEMLLLLRPELR